MTTVPTSLRRRYPLIALPGTLASGTVAVLAANALRAAVVWPGATAAVVPSVAVCARDYLVVTGWFGKPNANETADHPSKT